MRYFGLIGYPLGHSFSISFFSEKFNREGIDAVYDNYPLTSLENLMELVQANPFLEGLNVTLPYKKEIIHYLDYIDPVAEAIGAVNVVKIEREQENRIKLNGYNTDIIGFRRSLLDGIGSFSGKALILGTGGASLAVAKVLADLDISYKLVSRKADGDRLGYNDLNRQVLKEHKLIINTSPLGMYPVVDRAPDIPYKYLDKSSILYDLVYNPAETLFLKKGKERGAKTISGLKMLYIQAEEAWRVWNSK